MKINVLLSILALSLALLAYAERSAVPSPAFEEEKILSEPLFGLSSEEIDGITVMDQHGCVIMRKKALTSPRAGKLLESLLQARVIRRFAPVSSDLSPYGLTSESRRIVVEKINGGRRQSIDLGAANPSGSAIYARVLEEPAVLLVGGYFLASLNMALQELRAEGNRFFVRPCFSNTVE